MANWSCLDVGGGNFYYVLIVKREGGNVSVWLFTTVGVGSHDYRSTLTTAVFLWHEFSTTIFDCQTGTAGLRKRTSKDRFKVWDLSLEIAWYRKLAMRCPL